MNKKEVLIIMPAYNEAKTIEHVLEKLTQEGITEYADVLVLNDASSDGTHLVVKKHAGYAMVTHVYNLGYGSAIQVGYKYAIRRGYRYVIQMDSDGQHDVSNIPAIYEKLKTPEEDGVCPDIVLGSRYMEGSGEFKVGSAKKAAYAIFRFLIKIFTGKKIADPTTGLQGLSHRAALYYSKYNQFDYEYPDANMIIQMILLGFKVVEIPAVMHQRTSGKSMHSGIKPFIYMFRMTFSIIAIAFRIKVLERGITLNDRQIEVHD